MKPVIQNLSHIKEVSIIHVTKGMYYTVTPITLPETAYLKAVMQNVSWPIEGCTGISITFPHLE